MSCIQVKVGKLKNCVRLSEIKARGSVAPIALTADAVIVKGTVWHGNSAFHACDFPFGYLPILNRAFFAIKSERRGAVDVGLTENLPILMHGTYERNVVAFEVEHGVRFSTFVLKKRIAAAVRYAFDARRVFELWIQAGEKPAIDWNPFRGSTCIVNHRCFLKIRRRHKKIWAMPSIITLKDVSDRGDSTAL